MNPLMNLNEYQAVATKTAIYPGKNTSTGLVDTVFRLASEAQEIKYIVCDKDGLVDEESRQVIAEQLSNALLYIAATATELGLNLEEIAQLNLVKAVSQQEREALNDSGDEEMTENQLTQGEKIINGMTLIRKYEPGAYFAAGHDEIFFGSYEETVSKMTSEEMANMELWGWSESMDAWHFPV